MVRDLQLTTLLDETFATMSESDMQAHGLAAVRTCRAGMLVSMSHWRDALLNSVFRRTVIGSGSPNIPSVEDFRRNLGPDDIRDNQELRPIHARLLEFWAWMERAGYAISYGPRRICWLITELGEKRLEQEDPCRPGALQRLRDAHGAEFEASLACLEDAHACFEHGLLRPAVTLLGLAYEDMLTKVAAKLGVGKVKDARDRIAKVRVRLENEKNTDAREAALHALNAMSVAEETRHDRNTAGHEAEAQLDPVKVDELLRVATMVYGRLAGYQPAEPPKAT